MELSGMGWSGMERGGVECGVTSVVSWGSVLVLRVV